MRLFYRHGRTDRDTTFSLTLFLLLSCPPFLPEPDGSPSVAIVVNIWSRFSQTA